MGLFRRKAEPKVDPGAALAAALDAAGFWRDVPAERAALRAEVAAGTHPLAAAGERGWLVDGEDLAEGGVEALLDELGPALEARGIDLVVETLDGPYDEDSPGYAVSINGETIDLYRYGDEERVPRTEDPWTDCTMLPLAALNRLLAEAGADERFAVLAPGGNDAMAYLLPTATFPLLQPLSAGITDQLVVP